jgi:outer membrane protein assembly factor BamD
VRFSLWMIIGLGMFGVTACTEAPKQIRVPARELYQQAFVSYEDGFATEAERQFRELTQEHPGTRMANLAFLKLGDINFDRAKWAEAEADYRAFLLNSPQSHLTPYVLHRIIALNYERNKYGLFFRAREVDRNMEPNRRILQEYQRFALLYPQSPYLQDVEEFQTKARADLAEYELLVGNWYFEQQAFSSAISRYRHLLLNYPEFPRTQQVVERLVQAYERNRQPELARELQASLKSVRASLQK